MSNNLGFYGILRSKNDVGYLLKTMKREYIPMKRINTRIRPEQHVFIKSEAKEKKRTEGEIFREIIDYYINKK